MQRGKRSNQSDPELAGAVSMEELPANALLDTEPGAAVESEDHSLKPSGVQAGVPSSSRNMKILWRQFKGLPPMKTLDVPSNEPRFVPIFSTKNLLRKLGFRPDAAGIGPLDGAVIYDRNTASVLGLHLPLVLDMVRDSVKNRLQNVLGFAYIFCSVILILASFIFTSPQAAIPNQVFASPQFLSSAISHSFLLSDRDH